MKSSLVLCVLLGVALSVKAASLPHAVEVVTNPVTVTEPYSDTTFTLTTVQSTSTSPFTSAPSTITRPNSPSLSQIMCPSGWEVFQGRCYYFVNQGMTWPQAQSNCALLESMLVSIHSIQEYSFLQQLSINNEYPNAWLGGFYLQDQWLWIDGSWFYNNTWNNMFADSSNPCLMLNAFEAWNNSPCNAGGNPSICVKNSNVPSEMVCPEGWMGFRDRCYYYNYEPLTWPEADASCAGLGARLVSVHSPEEYSFLYQQTAVNGFSPAWLGGFYFDDQWMWLDGSWFYQGFFAGLSSYSTDSCLSTYSLDAWSNFNCGQTLLSFCVKDTL